MCYNIDNMHETKSSTINVEKKVKVSNKRSFKAKEVARRVIESARSSEIIPLKKIAMDLGYSEASASNGSVTRTKSYKEEIEPVLAQMDRIQRKILNEIENRDISKERVLDLSTVHKNILHDKQLTQGKSTEIGSVAPQIIVFASGDPLNKQLTERATVKEAQLVEDVALLHNDIDN